MSKIDIPEGYRSRRKLDGLSFTRKDRRVVIDAFTRDAYGGTCIPRYTVTVDGRPVTDGRRLGAPVKIFLAVNDAIEAADQWMEEVASGERQ